jgi:hypothetical protein
MSTLSASLHHGNWSMTLSQAATTATIVGRIPERCRRGGIMMMMLLLMMSPQQGIFNG